MRGRERPRGPGKPSSDGEAEAHGERLRLLGMRHKQKQRKQERVEFSDEEAGEVEGEQPLDAEGLVHDGVTAGQEPHAEEEESLLAELGQEIPAALEKAGIKSKATRVAMVPHLVELARGGHWKAMLDYLSASISPSEAMEIAKVVGEKLGIEIGEGILQAVESADIIVEGLEFEYQAFVALAEAHQAGERDNRALKYVEAWTTTLVDGPGARVSAELPEQEEAVQLGHRDATLTLTLWGERSGEIGRKMLERYGSESNVKHALQTELCKRAGFRGLKFHDG